MLNFSGIYMIVQDRKNSFSDTSSYKSQR